MRPTDQINLLELEPSILNQIPFSIRMRKDIYTFSELPIDVQYLIEKNHENKVPEIQYVDIIDADFEISSYSDFQTISNKRDFVKNNLKNYMQIRLGSYPYDVRFGCAIKDQLQNKDTSLRSTLLGTELYQISGTISNDYNMDVQITKFEVLPISNVASTDYYLSLRVKVGNDPTEVNI